MQGLHIISHDAIKVARAGSRGCLSTKVYKASSRGTDDSEQVHSKKSAPKEEVARSKGKLQHHGREPPVARS